MADQHRSVGKFKEARQHTLDHGWPRTMASVMPWIGDRRLRNRAPRVDQLLEDLLAQQPAIDNAQGADRDNFVDTGRQSGRLRVEDRIRNLAQHAIVDSGALPRLVKQVEIIVFGPARQ